MLQVYLDKILTPENVEREGYSFQELNAYCEYTIPRSSVSCSLRCANYRRIAGRTYYPNYLCANHMAFYILNRKIIERLGAPQYQESPSQETLPIPYPTTISDRHKGVIVANQPLTSQPSSSQPSSEILDITEPTNYKKKLEVLEEILAEMFPTEVYPLWHPDQTPRRLFAGMRPITDSSIGLFEPLSVTPAGKFGYHADTPSTDIPSEMLCRLCRQSIDDHSGWTCLNEAIDKYHCEVCQHTTTCTEYCTCCCTHCSICNHVATECQTCTCCDEKLPLMSILYQKDDSFIERLNALEQGEPSYVSDSQAFLTEEQGFFVLGKKDIVADLVEFYTLSDYADLYPILQEMYQKKAKKLADRILYYIIASCAGEARHIHSRSYTPFSRRYISEKFSPLAQSWIFYADNLRGQRTAIHFLCLKLIAATKDNSKLQPFLRGLVQIFAHPIWSRGGIGGKKWAKIAQEGVNYLQGKYTAGIFIDHIIDIVHHGGWAFNKYYTDYHGCRLHNFSLESLLFAKREGDVSKVLDKVCIDPQLSLFLKRLNALKEKVSKES